MSQKWKMCLVSERGQTRAWIFITCTATRWRRPIHQAELSRWSQTFPIKTPPTPTPTHTLSLPLLHCESRRSFRMGGKREERRDLFCTVMNFKTSTPHPQFGRCSAAPLVSLFFSHECLLWTEPGLFLAITFINTATAMASSADSPKGQERKARSQAA